MKIIEDLKDWADRPYDPSMSLSGWVAFILMLLVITILWRQVINFIVS